MSIGISQEHRELAASVDGWTARHITPEVLRSWTDGPPEGRDASWWTALAEQGLLGLHVDEIHGGSGYGHLELGVVLERAAAGLVPGPLMPTALAASLLGRAGSAPAVAEQLPGLVSGIQTAAVAVSSPPLTATVRTTEVLLSGRVGPVPAGADVDWILVPVEAPEGERWAVVRTAAAEVTGVDDLDGTRPAILLELQDHPVGVSDLLELPADLVRETAVALAAAEACGIAAWCTATAAEHARTRVQFGRPIGTFQAVKHLCATMLVRSEQAAAATWDALRALDEDGVERGLATSVAASVALDAAVDDAKDCIQVLGGIGFTWEHDAHRYLRRALALRQWLGGSARARADVAARSLAGERRTLSVDLGAEGEELRPAIAGEVAAAAEAAEPGERRRRLADRGLIAPHWPAPWGRDAGAVEQLVIADELRAAGIEVPGLVIGAWVVPTLIAHGTEAQQERFIRPTLHGEIAWCQLFSEPEAGSDLASLRTTATRTDGGWVLEGQKVWTSLARQADWGICLARTDPDVRKHRGITYFLVDMTAPGIDVRPLREITGDAMFNEVFLDGVVVPDDCVVGEVDGGWALARATLANERVAMATGSTMGRGVENILDILDGDPRADDPVVRDRLGWLVAEGQTLSVLGLRTTLSQLGGLDPGAAGSVRKLVGMDHTQDVAELSLDLAGAEALALPGRRDDRAGGFLQTRSLTIAGGTSQIQRSLIAERMLGLPRLEEPRGR